MKLNWFCVFLKLFHLHLSRSVITRDPNTRGDAERSKLVRAPKDGYVRYVLCDSDGDGDE